MSKQSDIPYVFFGSPPIGPIALRVLELNDYMPAKVVTDTSLSSNEMIEIIEEARAAFILVVGYGTIIKQDVLDAVAGQALNIHPSLLPRYRGPAPVVQTILDGAQETGVTLMEIDRKMDHGPILAQESIVLHGNETPTELYEILTQKGTRLFLDLIEDYLQGELEGIPQNEAEATVTHFIEKDDGLLDLSMDPHQLERMVRAYQGWPGTWVLFEGKRLLVHKAHVAHDRLVFDEVQPEGGKIMSLESFCNGKRITTADFSRILLGS